MAATMFAGPEREYRGVVKSVMDPPTVFCPNWTCPTL
jgi:hypothetical protein